MQASPSSPHRDPLTRVLDLGVERHFVAFMVALLVALFAHAAAAARVAMIHTELLAWSRALRLEINERLALTYDIDVEKPKPPPEAPPKEEPKPEEKAPPPPVSAPKEKTPPPPPAAAQAGAVLTQKPDDTPVDFTNSFVTGNADTYAGGVTQTTGTSNKAVYDRNAQAGGVPGGTGTAPVAKPTTPDRSRPLGVTGNNWDCPFPPEADSEQIDQMVVLAEVSVDASGHVTGAHALSDPGYGFARAAVQCALHQGAGAFDVAYDRDGNPIPGTKKIKINFTR